MGPRRVQSVSGAPLSRPAEIDERRKRYLMTMGLRTVLFLAAVFAFHGVLRWAAIGFSFIAPYVAVVAANSGPRRIRDTSSYLRPGPSAAAPADAARLVVPRPTIDAEPPDVS